MKFTRRKGFTIVELVIVIAVVAILAAVLIPTFVSLINDANKSVDEQLVTNMNKILATEEKISGKPVTVADAQAVLKAGGISNFKANLVENTFYWVGSENVVIIWTQEGDDPTVGEVTYPKKYAGTDTISQDWYIFGNAEGSMEYEEEIIEPTGEQTMEEAIIAAMQNSGVDDHVVLALPKNTNVSFSDTQLNEIYYAMLTDDNVGKDLTLNLNGSTIDSTKTDGYPVFQVPDGATLEIVNGKMDLVNNGYSHAGFQVDDGSSLVLRNVKIEHSEAYALFFPSSQASEIILENCDIKTDAYYGMMSNGRTSKNLKIIIKNTTFAADASHGILINVSSNVHIENSTISANAAAVTMRAGTLEVINSTLKTNNTSAGAYKWNGMALYDNSNTGRVYGHWCDGNRTPAGVLVLGDHSKANDDDYEGNNYSYQGDVNCTLENVKFESSSTEIPDILIGSRKLKNVTLTCTDEQATKVQLYNWPHKFGHGTVTVNGETKTFTDDKT